LGMLVDDAVVIVEAIYYRLRRGDPPLASVTQGVGEVGLPVLASVATTIAAFLPLMLLSGILGKFMFIVPFVVTVGLLVSLLEAFWILPVHVLALGALPAGERGRVQALRERLTHGLRLRYARALVAVLRRPRQALLALLLVMAA